MALIQLETNRFTDCDLTDLILARNDTVRSMKKMGAPYAGTPEDRLMLRVDMLHAIRAYRSELRDSELAEIEAMIDAVEEVR